MNLPEISPGFFRDTIHSWYRRNKRDLPWRGTCDPYRIWISEVILQQTRIAQGVPYYQRFIEQFPDISSLALAPDDDLMKAWEGLGYYSRARNLKAAAVMVASRHAGHLPADFQALKALPGIGSYTAAAVASIAFHLPCAAVDGNVARVLSRYFGIYDPIDSGTGRKLLEMRASEILDRDCPGFHNQAVMEFGALCCGPGIPDCSLCPLRGGCHAYSLDKVDLLPVKKKKTSKTTRYFYFYFFENETHFVVEKRTGKDIWKNLYQLPLFESAIPLEDHELLANPFITSFPGIGSQAVTAVSRVVKHQLTHQQIWARFISVATDYPGSLNSNYIEVKKKEIHKFAYPVLIAHFLEEQLSGQVLREK